MTPPRVAEQHLRREIHTGSPEVSVLPACEIRKQMMEEGNYSGCYGNSHPLLSANFLSHSPGIPSQGASKNSGKDGRGHG